MGWQKLGEHQFTFNEGSLNFTLTGAAFHDDDGDGVPDDVSFEQGRPVFMSVKNLRDFHFDVPRGYLIVNGDEYKLLDLDNNADNGEELQLFRAGAGFPSGEDRTNPTAYSKVSDHQFTYNEGSLNYTLTGAAFHDDDGDGVPDGVRIIGPKPCFGGQGEDFDTSVEAFHFKVPSGALMVNGERYSLAELDGNPDNGYELVIPEKATALGWTKLDEPIAGWAYKRPSDNNPLNMGSLKLFGAGLVDRDGNGEPDGLTIPTVRFGEYEDGVRITQIGLSGLRGDVRLNNPQFSLGVYNDDDYDYQITKHDGNLFETLITKISDGAILAVSSGTEVIETDGDGKLNILAKKSFRLDGRSIEIDGEKYLTVKFKGGVVTSIKEETLGFKTVGSRIEFTGRPMNDPTRKVKCSLVGAELDVDDLKVGVLRKVQGIGVRLGIEGLRGEVKLNGKSLGIRNDDNYAVHFTPLVDPNIATENLAQAHSLELLNISPNAEINSPGNWIILESDGVYHFADGDYYVATKPAHSPDELQRIVVNGGGKGVDVSVEKGALVPVDGLSLVSGAIAFNDADDDPERKIDNSARLEETMFGKPLRACGGSDEEGGSDDAAIEFTEADDVEAEPLAGVESDRLDVETDENVPSVELTSDSINPSEDVEVPVELEVVEVVPVEATWFEGTEFQRLEDSARSVRENKTVEDANELDALLNYSLAEILPIESMNVIEDMRATWSPMEYVVSAAVDAREPIESETIDHRV